MLLAIALVGYQSLFNLR